MVSGFVGRFPDVEMVRVAGCGDRQASLARSAVESGANICFRVGQGIERHFEGSAGRQPIEAIQ